MGGRDTGSGGPDFDSVQLASDRLEIIYTVDDGDPPEFAGSVSIFLGTDDAIPALKAVEGLRKFLAHMDVGVEFTQFTKGSIWGKGVWRRTGPARLVEDRLAKVEQALTARYLGTHQAEVDVNTAEAIRRLMEATKDVPGGVCVRAGSVLVVRTPIAEGGHLMVRQLSAIEMHHLDTYPELQGQPAKILDALSMVTASMAAPPPQ